MNGLPYYKAYPRDFIEGTIGMDFEVKGAYRLLLDLIYMQGGNLPDDARYISGLLGCSIRKWNSIRESLIGLGKIYVNGEFLSNYRADKELETLAKLQDTKRENRARSSKNKDLRKRPSDHTEPEPDTEVKDTNVSLPPSGDTTHANDLSHAVSRYNAAAQKAGWPQVQKLTPTRSQQLRQRLKDCGGPDGWEVALRKAFESDFCRGRTPKPWSGFAFDWLIKSANFNKLMEGNYDNRSGNNPAGSGQAAQGGGDRVYEQILDLAGVRATQGHDLRGTGSSCPQDAGVQLGWNA